MQESCQFEAVWQLRGFSQFFGKICKFVTTMILGCLVLKGYLKYRKIQEGLKTTLSSHPWQRRFLARRVFFYAYHRRLKLRSFVLCQKARLNRWIRTKKHRKTLKVSLLYSFYGKTRRLLHQHSVSLAWRLDREMRRRLILHKIGFTR